MRDGGFSTYSDIAAGFTVTGPPAPAAISAYVAGSTVAWVRTGMSPTTTGIRIERSFDGVSGWEQIASMTVSADGANDYLDADRTPEVRVCYRVFASNSFGEAAASNVDCAIPLAQPTDLVITQNPDESYQATWTDNSSNETLYLVSVYLCYPGYWCEWIYDLWLDQSSTFFAAGPNEYPGEIRACSDDGCSDSAAWATSSAASSLKASMMSRMPAAAKDDASASEGVRDLRERITKARRPIRR